MDKHNKNSKTTGDASGFCVQIAMLLKHEYSSGQDLYISLMR